MHGRNQNLNLEGTKKKRKEKKVGGPSSGTEPKFELGRDKSINQKKKKRKRKSKQTYIY